MLLADLVDAQGMPEPDGLLEVVTANGGLANTVTAVGVTGGPLPVLSKLGLLDFASAVPASLGAGDLDGDGRQDLLVASAGKLDVFLEFTQQPSSTLLVSNFGDPSSVELGDLDLDGDLDVIIPDEEASLVQVFYQTVDGVLQLDTSSAISAVLGPRHVNLSDLDGDGELDISVVNEGAVIGEGLGIFFGGH